MTIYGSSKHPVLIKKINLNIWLLRDEIENILARRIIWAKSQGIELSIDDLKREYSPQDDPATPIADLELTKDSSSVKDESNGNDEEDLESAMAAAITGEEGKDEDAGDDSSNADDEEDLEAAMATAITGEEGEKGEEDGENAEDQGASVSDIQNKPVINQRHPHLPKEKISFGKTILSEIYMDKMFMFTDNKFVVGRSIVVEFNIPKKFVLNADVIYCSEYNLKNRIISDTKFSYRLAIKFTFLKKGERTLLRQFISSIEPDIDESAIAKTEKKEKKEEDLDDVLNGLDL
ncbi:MAG: hypothetical protein KAQ98_03470 [Bacteriovoracaceae bacterium]|nr:hypothetical protein [Bacteriovoracaceae bacterium]